MSFLFRHSSRPVSAWRCGLRLCPLLAACLCLPAASENARQNLLKNGGFESVEPNGTPTGWIYITPPGETADYKIITDKPKEGRQCLRIKGHATWAAAITADRFPIDASKTYVLSGWLRVIRGQGIIKFDYFQGDQHLGQTMSELLGPGADWKGLTVRTESSAYPAATHVIVTIAGLGELECDFDALVLKAQ